MLSVSRFWLVRAATTHGHRYTLLRLRLQLLQQLQDLLQPSTSFCSTTYDCYSCSSKKLLLGCSSSRTAEWLGCAVHSRMKGNCHALDVFIDNSGFIRIWAPKGFSQNGFTSEAKGGEAKKKLTSSDFYLFLPRLTKWFHAMPQFARNRWSWSR